MVAKVALEMVGVRGEYDYGVVQEILTLMAQLITLILCFHKTSCVIKLHRNLYTDTNMCTYNSKNLTKLD